MNLILLIAFLIGSVWENSFDSCLQLKILLFMLSVGRKAFVFFFNLIWLNKSSFERLLVVSPLTCFSYHAINELALLVCLLLDIINLKTV